MIVPESVWQLQEPREAVEREDPAKICDIRQAGSPVDLFFQLLPDLGLALSLGVIVKRGAVWTAGRRVPGTKERMEGGQRRAELSVFRGRQPGRSGVRKSTRATCDGGRTGTYSASCACHPSPVWRCLASRRAGLGWRCLASRRAGPDQPAAEPPQRHQPR